METKEILDELWRLWCCARDVPVYIAGPNLQQYYEFIRDTPLLAAAAERLWVGSAHLEAQMTDPLFEPLPVPQCQAEAAGLGWRLLRRVLGPWPEDYPTHRVIPQIMIQQQRLQERYRSSLLAMMDIFFAPMHDAFVADLHRTMATEAATSTGPAVLDALSQRWTNLVGARRAQLGSAVRSLVRTIESTPAIAAVAAKLADVGYQHPPLVQRLLLLVPEIPEFDRPIDAAAFGWRALVRLRRMQEEGRHTTLEGALIGMLTLAEWPLRHLGELPPDAAVEYVINVYLKPTYEHMAGAVAVPQGAADEMPAPAQPPRRRPDLVRRNADTRVEALSWAIAVMAEKPHDCQDEGERWVAERIATTIVNTASERGENPPLSHDLMSRLISQALRRLNSTRS